MTHVILTNEEGLPQGVIDTLEAHSGEGMLHKAFSVYVFRHDGEELLIQRRSQEKMLWPGFWANTCCSHPRQGESALEAGMRRLEEECGFTCPLREMSSFVYHAEDPEGRGVEYEHVTLLVGEMAPGIVITPNPREIAEYRWVQVRDLWENIHEKPHLYAPWLHLGFEVLAEDIPLSVINAEASKYG
jgi:isopentenyl-diphosphate delta-isomerase